MAKLSGRQRKFAEEYLAGHDAVEAAVRAGYTRAYAGTHALGLLENPAIAAYLRERTEEGGGRTGVTRERVLQELARVAFANGADYASISDGRVVITGTDELTEDQRAAVVGIRKTSTGVEIRLGDKLRALGLLGRHLGMFTGCGEQDAEDIEAARREVFDGGENADD